MEGAIISFHSFLSAAFALTPKSFTAAKGAKPMDNTTNFFHYKVFLKTSIFHPHFRSSYVCDMKQVMANQEAVDIARRIKDPLKAAKQLITEALEKESKDDISCIVVRFR